MNALPAPLPPAELVDFPRHTLSAGQPLLRIHRRERGPLWFAHDGAGRFDLPPPRGTLYAAGEGLGAFVEVFRSLRLIPDEEVAVRRLSSLAPRRPLRLADCVSRRALAFGLTAAVHSTPAYGETREWAAAFAAAGFDGVRYLVRHDPAQRLIGYALFGAAGAGEVAGHADFEVLATTPIPHALTAAAARSFGLLVLPAAVSR